MCMRVVAQEVQGLKQITGGVSWVKAYPVCKFVPLATMHAVLKFTNLI